MSAWLLAVVAATCVAAGGRTLARPPLRVASLTAPRAQPGRPRGRWRAGIVVRRQARAEADRARDAIPDLASILVLAVHAGLNAPLGLRAVAPATSGIVRTALDEVERRHQAGERFADALTALDQLEGAPAHAIVRALTDHLRDGTALVPALERAANDLRADRRRRAEARARRAPVALLFPLVTCIFPAFVLLTVVPLLAGALAELHL